MDKISSLGMPPVSPQEIFKRYKHQSLGMFKASPSSSTKISGLLSRHYFLLHILCVVLGASLFLSLVLFSFVCCNKLVGPQHTSFGEVTPRSSLPRTL